MSGQCAAPDCEKASRSKGYCNLHYQRVLRYGDPAVYIGQTGRPLKGDQPTWIAAHQRVRRARGNARDHVCVDCGKQAREWSYNNRDPHPLYEQRGKSLAAYSLDVSNYEPRCVSCHRRFDFAERQGVSS